MSSMEQSPPDPLWLTRACRKTTTYRFGVEEKVFQREPSFPLSFTLLLSELLCPGRGASTQGHLFQQLHILAGLWGHLRLWVPGWKRLPELLLLLWGVQRRRVEKRSCPYRFTRAGRVFSRLFPHFLFAVQHRLLGRLSLPLAHCRSLFGHNMETPNKLFTQRWERGQRMSADISASLTTGKRLTVVLHTERGQNGLWRPTGTFPVHC